MTPPPLSALQTLALAPLFSGVGPEVLGRLAAQSQTRVLRPGEAIARRGETQTQLFIVQCGQLSICVYGHDGKRHVARYLTTGEVFGLIPVLDGGAAVHDADAHGMTRLLQVPREAILSELHADPAFAMRLLHLLCNRSRKLYQAIMFTHLLSLDARVGQLLLSLAQIEMQGAHAPEQTAEIQMTQSDMSDMLGVSRQSLSVELKKLERQGLIKIAHAKLFVMNLLGLEHYAGGGI